MEKKLLILVACMFLGGCPSESTQKQQVKTTPTAPKTPEPDNEGDKNGGEGSVLAIEKDWFRSGGPTKIETEILRYGSGLKGPLEGFFIRPVTKVYNGPVIIAVHNDAGISIPFKQMLTRLVAANYQVFAVNLYEVSNPPSDKENIQALAAQLKQAGLVNILANIKQATDYLFDERKVPEIALMGWGTGGRWATEVMLKYPGVYKVAVNFYGGYDIIATFGTIQKSNLQTPSMHILPANDPNLDLDKFRGIPKMLQDVSNPTVLEFFNGVDYGFFEPDQPGYLPSEAKIALNKVIDFLTENFTPTK